MFRGYRVDGRFRRQRQVVNDHIDVVAQLFLRVWFPPSWHTLPPVFGQTLLLRNTARIQEP